MHELSIAQSLIDTIRETAAAHPGTRVTKVGVRIGDLSGVQPDALLFSFEIIVRGTEFEHAALEVERIALQQHCATCGRDFPVVDFTFSCPACGGPTQAVAGDELQVAYVELE